MLVMFVDVNLIQNLKVIRNVVKNQNLGNNIFLIAKNVIKNNVNLSLNEYQKGDYKKHCSRKCSNSHIQTEKQNQLRRQKLKGKELVDRIKKECVICNKYFKILPHRIIQQTCGKQYCKNELNSIIKRKSDDTYRWKNINGKTIREHTIIMEKHIGRKLLNNECIHHINGIKRDNRIENLLLTTKEKHPKLHKNK